MKKEKVALLALFMAFLGMFLVTSQNIKAGVDDVLEENACIMIDDAEGNSYEYYGVMYEKGDVVTKSLSLKGPVSVTIVADNGSYCGYYSSCVTLRGDYYYNLNTTGTYTFTVIDYYGSNKEVYVTYNITITVTKIIESSSGSSSESGSSGSSGGSSSSGGTTSSTAPVWNTNDLYKIYSGTPLEFKLTGTNIYIEEETSTSTYYSYYYRYGWSTSSSTKPSYWSEQYIGHSSSMYHFKTTPSKVESGIYYLWLQHRGKDDSGNLATFSGKQPISYGDTYDSCVVYEYYIIGDDEAPIWYTDDIYEIESGQELNFQLTDLFEIEYYRYANRDYSYYGYSWSTSSTETPSSWSYKYSIVSPTKISFTTTAPFVKSNTNYYLWIYKRGKDLAGNVATFSGKEPYSCGDYLYLIYEYHIKEDNEAPVWYTEDITEINSGTILNFQLTDNKKIWGFSSASTYYKYGWYTSTLESNFTLQTSNTISFSIKAPYVTEDAVYSFYIYYQGKDAAGNLATFKGKSPASSNTSYSSKVIYNYTVLADSNDTEAPVWYTEDVTEINSGDSVYVQLTDNRRLYSFLTASEFYCYGWSTTKNSKPTWLTTFIETSATKVSFSITAPMVTYSKTYYLWISSIGKDYVGNISTFSGKEPYYSTSYYTDYVKYKYTINVSSGSNTDTDTDADTEPPVWYTEDINEVVTNTPIYFEITDNIELYNGTYTYWYDWSISDTESPTWDLKPAFISTTTTKVSFMTTAPKVTQNTTYYLWIFNRGADTSGNVAIFSGKTPHYYSEIYYGTLKYKYTILADTTSPNIRLNSSSGEVLEDKQISYHSNVPLTLFFEDKMFKNYVVSGADNYTGTGDRYIISSAGSYSISAYDYAGNMTSIAIEINDDGTVPSKAIINDAKLNNGQISFTISGNNNIQEEYKNGIAVYFVGKYGNYSTDVLLEDGFKKYGVTYSPSNNMPASKFFEKGAITTPQGLIGNVELYIMLKLDDKDTNPLILKSGSINITNTGSANIIFNSSETEVASNEVKEITLSTSNIVIKENIRKPNYMLFVSMIIISSLLALEVIVIKKHKKAL